MLLFSGAMSYLHAICPPPVVTRGPGVNFTVTQFSTSRHCSLAMPAARSSVWNLLARHDAFRYTVLSHCYSTVPRLCSGNACSLGTMPTSMSAPASAATTPSPASSTSEQLRPGRLIAGVIVGTAIVVHVGAIVHVAIIAHTAIC